MLSRISDHLSDLQNQSDESQDSFQTGSVEGQSHVHFSGDASAQDTGMVHTSGVDSSDITYDSDNDMADTTEGVQMKIVSLKKAIILKICFILKMYVVKQMMKVTLILNRKHLSLKSLGSWLQAFRYLTTHY